MKVYIAYYLVSMIAGVRHQRNPEYSNSKFCLLNFCEPTKEGGVFICYVGLVLGRLFDWD